jgi:hypothetical protein
MQRWPTYAGWAGSLRLTDDGLPMLAGITADGREIIGLYGLEPITTMPTLAEAAEATEELAKLAGMTVSHAHRW